MQGQSAVGQPCRAAGFLLVSGAKTASPLITSVYCRCRVAPMLGASGYSIEKIGHQWHTARQVSTSIVHWYPCTGKAQQQLGWP